MGYVGCTVCCCCHLMITSSVAGTGYEEDIGSIGAGKEFALIKTVSGKVCPKKWVMIGDLNLYWNLSNNYKLKC